MKIRISATVDERIEDILNALLEGGEFRNKSHAVEKAIELLWRIKNDKDKE